MSKKCPPGVICTDRSTLWLFVFVVAATVGLILWFSPQKTVPRQETKTVYVMQQQPRVPEPEVNVRPPIRQYNRGGGPIQQIGILTGEGGSSSSAAPDRTILPLFGRELDVRRSRWNYYTRTDGFNPVQVPVRVGNRMCDDDTNGCNEVFSDDTVHVPALSRSFKASVYKVY